MTNERYASLLSITVSGVVKEIVKEERIDENEALKNFLNSYLYSLLEDEDLKLWYYGDQMLYSLYKEEKENGKIIFPDV